ncbi:ribosome small subunit-dependent GTPase A [Marinifilum breve]|uniref:Small ribosomal subunit biogenesis GTPase RsgA n=1 Tax=Marinifilum breve TaxID=2184082 RepID=A0A2V3ZT27_9BACT|nr:MULTISPECIES: ribosome small subunit-dependent GTPase A [Marinifilum]MDQ2179353.1 ribosome small subunit-dependent GTPase A [Marinifilum sp. D714]PXX97018.1 ribosome small subunit-dependent GTPase A [Marinifilum breve]
MKEGLVIKSTGSWYTVKTNDGEIHNCRIKGRFRMEGIRTTNPIAVGDRVNFEEDKESKVIVSIHDRKNYIIRKSSNLSKHSQIIASNVDQAFLIVTVNYPLTTTTFIDRFLAAAEAYRIPVRLIFNKIDRYRPNDMDRLDELKGIYEKIGYKCYEISAKNGTHLDIIKDALKDNINLLSGHSGVGKSTLINAIQPGLDLKTGEISEAHSQGKHTTTFSEMFELDFGGYIIDTPGIRGFGTIDMEKEEMSHFFPEIFETSQECQFNNCSHIHEPKCAVKAAVEAGEISITRYESYLGMVMEDEDSKYRI